MKYTRILISIIAPLLLFSCNNDESTINQQSNAIDHLTNGNSKVWKISNALLTNAQGTIDISQNFNVLDDEFTFYQSGELKHARGKGINLDAQNLKDSKLDQDRSAVTLEYAYNNDNPNMVATLGGKFDFEILSTNQIKGELAYPEYDATISVVLTPKTSADYLQPSAQLNFNDLYTFNFDLHGTGYTTPGMIGSYRENSLYIVLPNANGLTGYNGMLKFDLNTNEYIEVVDSDGSWDLVTKQLHFIDKDLVVVGGRNVSQYDLNLNRVEAPIDHSLEISRFGTSAIDDKIYVVGGSFTEDTAGEIDAEKIYRWNTSDKSLELIGALPEDRIGARSAMNDNKLYVFGGMSSFFPIIPEPNNSIYIYDIATGGVALEQMNTGMEVSYVSKIQNLIYVAGSSRVVDASGDWIDDDFSFGVYNLQNGTYEELGHNIVEGQDEYINVHSMTVHNNKMYILTIMYPNMSTNDTINLSLKVADLD